MLNHRFLMRLNFHILILILLWIYCFLFCHDTMSSGIFSWNKNFERNIKIIHFTHVYTHTHTLGNILTFLFRGYFDYSKSHKNMHLKYLINSKELFG